MPKIRMRFLRYGLEAKEFFTEENKKLLELSESFDGAHLSPSFIKSWNQCPAYAFISALPRREEPAPLLIGTEVHRILQLKYEKNLDEEQTLKLCDECEVRPSYIPQIRDYVKAYFSIEPYGVFPTEPEHKMELELKGKISPLGVSIPVPIKGFIDRMDIFGDGVCIVDYKTGKRPPRREYNIDQMITYKWLTEEVYGAPVKGVYIASLFVPKPRYIEQEPTLVEQSKLIDKILDTYERVEASTFKRIFRRCQGFQCAFCRLKDQCHSGREVEVVYDTETHGMRTVS